MSDLENIKKFERLENTASNLIELTEQDFYPIEDNRLYTSGIDDIDGGDGFADYTEWFWDEYEHEIYD